MSAPSDGARADARKARLEALPEVESVKRIEVGPNDVLIVTVPGRLNQQQAHDLQVRIRSTLRSERVLIVSDGIRIDVAELPEVTE